MATITMTLNPGDQPTKEQVEEIKTAKFILRTLGMRKGGIEVVSCPTCGRTEIPLQKIANQVKERLEGITAPLHVAVMGCVVNGPGEAEQADFGIAGGKDSGLVFRYGKVIKTLPSDQLVDGLMEEIHKHLSQNS